MLRTTLAGLRAHKLRLLLTAVAITLGVGFISGTFVLTDTMDKGISKTFAKSADKVDLAVVPKSDDPDEGVPADLLGKVRALPGVTDAQGVVQGDAALVGRDGKAVGDFPTVGMSVPSGRLLRYDVDKGRPPSGGGEAVLDTKLAKREGFGVGDTVTVLDGKERPHRFRVAGLVDFGIDQEASFRGAVGFDPATAMRMTGEKTYRELDITGGNKAAVKAAAGGSYDVFTGEELGARLAKAAGADTKIIRSGLLIFGLVAMLVSALVIYNTFSILIAQRMREMALLRCVGATRRQVFGGVLAESFAVGLVGSLLGLVAGVGLGEGALVAVNRLNAAVAVAGPSLAVRTIVIGLLIGVVVTVLSALLPARAATRVAPVAALRADLEPGSGRFRLGWIRTGVAAVLGAAGLALGTLGSVVMEKGETAMYVVAFAGGVFFLAVIAAMPALVRPLGRLAGAVPGRLGGVPGRLAVSNAQRAPRRTATTTIALTVGVGLMSLFAVVAASGKATASSKLEEQFPVQFQIRTQDFDGTVPHALAESLRTRPEVTDVVEERREETTVAGDDGDISTITPSALGTILKPDMKQGTLAGAQKPGTAMVDEATAKVSGRGLGQTVQVRTPSGTVPVKITAVYGAGSSLDGIMIPEADFIRYFGVRDPVGIYVKTRDEIPASQARRAVEDAARPYPAAKVVSSAEFEESMSKAIDMVLMIFGGLLGLAIVIALFGIANTLTLSVVERTRESALLRALGLTKRQLRRMLSVEALVMAVIGAFTGVVLGIGFGWAATNAMAVDSIFALPYVQVIGFVVLAGAAGMIAAVMPARRAAKASVVESLAHD
ncbi:MULTISPECIES: ABC transporter permease [Actinomadura]|uniref:Putative ABC transport system permease protein n=1 Tax=Actinomadura madurae TaxID=1993 RepID=A0A1I5ENU3_9ACTN|nr:FtsX-like permease family protein [Actinomadura madurae]SFO13175.1 putative ABC transport system permease protein [Actinomadura madurae]SPT60028.1 Macrolide export ATP-binding/permease protein MacB [Actinomadura madurae]